MGKKVQGIRWAVRPQLFVVGLAAVCCLGAVWGWTRSQTQTIQSSLDFKQQVGAAQTVRPDCSAKPCIALTFDDGPNPEVTPQILDILQRYQVKATFFLVGARVPGNESIVQREYREGHEVGNHSWSHPDLSSLTPEGVQYQIKAAQQVISSAGVPMPRLLRPPYGSINDMVAAHNNMTVVRWNIDPEDWHLRDPGLINQQLMANVRPGSIILLHDIYHTTTAALEPMLQTLQQTYQFVTVSQLLNLSSGDQGQYFAR